MRKYIYILLIIPMTGGSTYAQQNHVLNGSFEYYYGCPTASAQIDSCIGWHIWVGTPDYFNSCNTSVYNVPFAGNGYQMAASGNAYVAGFCHNNGPRENVTSQIVPLQIADTYEVSLSVSLSNGSKYGTNSIGVYFYDTGLKYHTYPHVSSIIPQVAWPNIIVTDTQNWVRLSAIFVADSSYDNIAIGGFRDSSNISYTNIQQGGSGAYYYYDSIVVKRYKRFKILFPATVLCIGDTIRVPYIIENISSSFFKSNNTFSLQLSDANGSFTSPITLGTKNSYSSDTITGVLPTSLTSGSGYRLRMISSNGQDTTKDNGFDIGIGTTIPNKPIAGSNTPLCSGDSLLLTATSGTGGVNWSWRGPNGFISNTQNPFIANSTVAASGSYIVTATLFGCRSSDTETVIVNQSLQPITASGNTGFCGPDTLKLTATNTTPAGASYSWTGPNSFTSNQQNPQIPSANSINTGNYFVTAIRNGCSAKDTVSITVKPMPVFTAGSNSPLCEGGALQFTTTTSQTGIAYSWSGPNSFTSSSVNPSISGVSVVHSGDYYVTANLNGCISKDTVTILVKPLPVAPIANSNTPLCAGSTLNLTASTSTGGVSWSWTGPGSFTSTSQNPNIANSTTAMSGDYIVTADLNGCSRKDTATVLVKPLPTAITTSNNSPICVGDSLKIFSTASTTGVTYAWAGPNSFSASTQNTSIANSSTAATGWYRMTVNLNGCTYKDSSYATVNAIPATPTVSYNNPLCVGETLKLTASAVTSASYSWTGVNNFTSNQQNPNRANMQFGDTGTYSVTTTMNGCTSAATNLKVYINPQPFVVILANPGDSICTGAPALFTAYPNNHGGTPTYQWYVNGTPSGTGVVYNGLSLAHGNIVRCDMTENTKCSVPITDPSNDITMKVLPWLAPSVSISANPTASLKPNEYVNFTATVTNGGAFPTYQWKRNGVKVVGATGNVWSANTLNDNDTISVEVLSKYKCPAPPTVLSNKIVVKILSSVGDVGNNGNFKVYPNPTKNTITITSAISIDKVEILNLLGQKLLSQKSNATTMTIDLGKFAAGVYVIKVNDSFVSRVVKE